MLKLKLTPYERIYIGKDIKVMLMGVQEELSQYIISCGIIAPREMKICREADLVYYYTAEDADDIVRRMGPPPRKIDQLIREKH